MELKTQNKVRLELLVTGKITLEEFKISIMTTEQIIAKLNELIPDNEANKEFLDNLNKKNDAYQN